MDIKKLFQKKYTIFIIAIILGLLLRVLCLDNVMYFGESDNANFDAYFNSEVSHAMLSSSEEPWMKPYLEDTGFIEFLPNHPFLSTILYRISTWIFGNNTVSFRLVSLIFGLLSTWYVFRLARLMYGKKTALYTLLLSSLSFWFLLSSVSVDQHHSILIFLITASIYHYLKSDGSKLYNKNFMLSVVFMGLAFMESYLAIIGAAALGLFILISRQKISDKIFTSIKFALPVALIFSLFPLISFLTNKYMFLRTIQNSGNIAGLTLNYLVPVYFMIWGTVLLCGLLFLALFDIERRDLIFYLLLIFGIIFNILSVPGIAALDRYLMIILPAMIILGAKFLAKIKFTKTSIWFGIVSFIVGFMLITSLNINVDYFVHDLSNYADKAVAFDWNFYFPITGPSGPVFGMSFSSIIVPFIIGMLLCIVAVIGYIRTKRFSAIIISLFLGLAIAQNVFMAIELSSPSMHPDITRVSMDSYDYVNEIIGDKILITNNLQSWYYVDRNYNNFLPFFGNTLQEFNQRFESVDDGVALVINYPMMQEDNEYWQTIKNNCNLEKTFSDSIIELAFVYSC